MGQLSPCLVVLYLCIMMAQAEAGGCRVQVWHHQLPVWVLLVRAQEVQVHCPWHPLQIVLLDGWMVQLQYPQRGAGAGRSGSLSGGKEI